MFYTIAIAVFIMLIILLVIFVGKNIYQFLSPPQLVERLLVYSCSGNGKTVNMYQEGRWYIVVLSGGIPCVETTHIRTKRSDDAMDVFSRLRDEVTNGGEE